MLLYLITLIALVGASLLEREECTTKYRCFAPLNCNSESLLGAVVAPDPACFVLLMMHPYSHNWYRIRLESVVTTTKINVKVGPKNTPIYLLTCEKDNDGKMSAKYNTEDLELIESHDATKFVCEFNVDLIRLGHTKVQSNDLHLTFLVGELEVTGGNPMKTKLTSLTPTIYCLPNVILAPRDNFAEDKFYEIAKYDDDNGAVTCENSEYKIEFRGEDSENYAKVNKVSCDMETGEGFKIDPTPSDNPTIRDELDVRCAGDADYFCDYNLKYTKGETPLEWTKPDMAAVPPVKGRIKCPATHPFFVVRGRQPIRNEVIKCKSYSNKMKWTYYAPDNTKMILGETSPEVHCVAQLKCSDMHKIPQTSLNASFLNENFEPACQQGGKLVVHEGNWEKRKIYEKMICEGMTGQYRYQAKGASVHSLTKSTIFSCEYEDTTVDENKDNLLIMIGSVISAFFTAFIIAIVCAYCVMRKQRNRENAIKNKVETNEGNDTSLRMGCDRGKQFNDKDQEIANDYLRKKKSDALNEIHFNILPGKVPILRRVKGDLSKEVQANGGQRPGEYKKLTKPKPMLTEDMKEMINGLRMCKKC
ncbi:hypothetical protein PFISCL1PPCAC_4541 [Pristionchus fissidentatus]|uniref:Uncharacterized protein n=1 Tax=Pristionchus fissidentatus TaxID=1538716 RepID=A0AAV5V3X8_9BILA|nr:hypothetical protein PFISCL1PPCAC_4541 [Pristionchus fissidentatus]